MKQISISQVDAFFADGSYPIELMIFYPKRISTSTVRAALKRVSGMFWPAFSCYLDGSIHRGSYREDNHFQEIVFDTDFDPDSSPREIQQTYAGLNPSVDQRLFFLTLVQHPNGTMLIPKLNHLAGDGYSYFYLLSVMAAMATASPIKRTLIPWLAKPNHNRTVLKGFHLDRFEREKTAKHQELEIEIVRVPKRQIDEKLKGLASPGDENLSANDILSAMVVRQIASKHHEDTESRFTLSIPIDVRRNVKEYGKKYFGNGVHIGETLFDTRELAKMDDIEIARSIRQSMPRVDRSRHKSFLEQIEDWLSQGQTDRLRPYDPDNGCLVTNLTKMPVNHLDFGSGQPTLVLPLTLAKNSVVVLDHGDDYLLRMVHPSHN